MKKFILPLLILLFVGSLFAVESAPSEVVGYFKLSATDGAYHGVTIPFAYNDLTIQSVFGDQMEDSDELILIGEGTSSVYYDGFGWFGDLENAGYGNAYYFRRNAGNGDMDYFLLGKVDPQGFTKTIQGNGAYTAFGLNSAAPVLVDDSIFGLNVAGDDELIEIGTGVSTVYYDGFGWFGDLEYISPTKAYYYKRVTGEGSFTWTYNPGETRGSNVIQSSRSTK